MELEMTYECISNQSEKVSWLVLLEFSGRIYLGLKTRTS